VYRQCQKYLSFWKFWCQCFSILRGFVAFRRELQLNSNSSNDPVSESDGDGDDSRSHARPSLSLRFPSGKVMARANIFE